MFTQACHNEYLFSSLYNVFLLSDSLYESNVQIQELKFAIGSQFPKKYAYVMFPYYEIFQYGKNDYSPIPAQ